MGHLVENEMQAIEMKFFSGRAPTKVEYLTDDENENDTLNENNRSKISYQSHVKFSNPFHI